MKLSVLIIVSFVVVAKGWRQKYGNDFVTYSIGERFERGDFLIRNETVESKSAFYHWPRRHRLEYRIENQDDLLSFAQIDIIDTDEPHEVHINTQPNYYEFLVISAKKIRGIIKIYHKAPENFHHLTRLFPGYYPQHSHRH